MAFRATFDCLWCGTHWTARADNDLEGWAQLCPTCLGKAGDNPFLRGRLRRALSDRVSASQASSAAPAAQAHAAGRSTAPKGRPAAAAFPDDWFLRRGVFERGPIHDAAWAAELDAAGRWIDGLALRGRVVEPAAGVGFFSPLLAESAELYAFDADEPALDHARERLLAHGLAAHLHVASPWSAPVPDPGPADGLFAAFLVGRVRGAGLDGAIESLRDRLRPAGGRLVILDLLPDPDGGPPPGIPWTFHEPAVHEASLRRAGLADVAVTTTGRFLLEATGVAR